MRKYSIGFAFVLAVILGLGLTSSLTWAKPTQTGLAQLVNGSPVYAGVMTTNATSVTNATTAAPFALAGGQLIKVTCSAAAFITVGATASGTFTAADIGHPMAVGEKLLILLPDSPAVATIAQFSAAAASCAVWRMQ